ncbi:MAG: hypothetical protein RLZZ370_1747 [Bacteroidota bacterium]
MKQAWNLEKVQQFNGHHQGIYALAYEPESNTLYSSGPDGFVVAWVPEGPDQGKLIAHVPEAVFALLPLHKDILLAGTAFGSIYMIRMSASPTVEKFKGHQGAVFTLKKNAAGNGWYSGGKDGYMLEWNDRGEWILGKKCSDESLRCIAVAKDKVAAGFSDTYIRQWSAFSSDATSLAVKAHQSSVFSLAFNDSGSCLFSGGRDAALKQWDANNGLTLIREVPAHWSHINHMELSPNQKLLATASMDKTIRIWNAEDLELLKVIDSKKVDAHQSSVNRVLWINDELVASGADDRTIRLFRIFKSD